MKQIANYNFISIMIISIILIIFSGIIHSKLSSTTSKINKLQSGVQTIYEQTIASKDVEGYGPKIGRVASAIGSLGSTLVKILLIWIPIIISILILAPAALARCIYSSSGGRLFAYRVIMGLDYFMLILLTYLFFKILFSGLIPSMFYTILLGIFILYMLIVIITGIRNTYFVISQNETS